EQRTLEINILQMQSDLCLRYNEVLESSHHGTPMLVQQVRSGGRGRPRTMIDPVLLAWAYSQRSTSSIAHFFNVGRTTVRRLLLEYGIVQPGAAPTNLVHADDNFVLDPNAIIFAETYIGLIRFGIVIHGFIDGYSQLITGLHASNNNRASTVLQVFLAA
ncbi:hypothetical protein C8J56DRAFT_723714, partial [Mycena floridula]